MKLTVGAGFGAALLVCAAAWAQGEEARRPSPVLSQQDGPDYGAWRQPLGASGPEAPRTRLRDRTRPSTATASPEDIDVVDARWMALTMWGEARGGGKEAMRAVGHVIDNRRRAGMHGRFVTETVSAAFQFSCWNPGDPNRAAMMNVDSLRAGSEEHRMWETARRLAEEILVGRSADPTGGALFYHTAEVAPRWSAGIVPVATIGGHLFFRTAR